LAKHSKFGGLFCFVLKNGSKEWEVLNRRSSGGRKPTYPKQEDKKEVHGET